jgi:EAL domain-containing protein (putative c-di-GMP-specific phosphodiesterase class I)/FixJ family two-component response regulator
VTTTQATPDRIKVLVADDEETVRQVIGVLVASDPGMDLVGLAADAESAIELAAVEHPDVALVDVRMPGGGGLRAVREIGRLSPLTIVIALSAHEDLDTVLKMLRAGALSYVAKSDSTDEIMWAIHRSIEGRSSLPKRLAAPVAAALAESVEDRGHASRKRILQRERIAQVVEDRAFSMVFQPIFDLEEGYIAGVEALARFDALPKRPPDAWIGEAKAVGLHVDLEMVLVRAALDQLGRIPSDLFLAINLSPEATVSRDLAEVLTGIEPSRIAVELTEHAPIDDYETLSGSLVHLRERGLRLAVDDAGAGFASLRHIVQLEPDLIKLDITLTRGIDFDPVSQALVGALASFANQIGASVVAEGVETKRQLVALRKAGVGFAQGFYLGRPGPIPDDGTWSSAGVG